MRLVYHAYGFAFLPLPPKKQKKKNARTQPKKNSPRPARAARGRGARRRGGGVSGQHHHRAAAHLARRRRQAAAAAIWGRCAHRSLSLLSLCQHTPLCRPRAVKARPEEGELLAHIAQRVRVPLCSISLAACVCVGTMGGVLPLERRDAPCFRQCARGWCY